MLIALFIKIQILIKYVSLKTSYVTFATEKRIQFNLDEKRTLMDRLIWYVTSDVR